jgi:hypothetical protein
VGPGPARPGPSGAEAVCWLSVCLSVSQVFINDVLFCAYHVLRLLWYGADLACGVDLLLEPNPRQYLKRRQPDKYRKASAGPTFYDIWVARDERGHSFDWERPYALNVSPVQSSPVESSRRSREGGLGLT